MSDQQHLREDLAPAICRCRFLLGAATRLTTIDAVDADLNGPICHATKMAPARHGEGWMSEWSREPVLRPAAGEQ